MKAYKVVILVLIFFMYLKVVSGTPINLNVISPINNTTYHSTEIEVNYTFNSSLVDNIECFYELYDYWISNVPFQVFNKIENCENITLNIFKDGNYSICVEVIYYSNGGGYFEIECVLFTVDILRVINQYNITSYIPLLMDKLNDSSTEKYLEYDSAGYKVVGIEIPKNSDVIEPEINVGGYKVLKLPTSPLWTYTAGGGIDSSPAVANGIVYVGSYDKKIYALNASTGEEIWNYTTGGFIGSSPAIANGIVYVGSGDGKIYALNATTGEEIWNYTTGSYVYSSPAIANGIVYVGSYDNKLYALNASTGEEIWNYTTGNYVHSSPAVANGIVYVGSYDNKLYAFDFGYISGSKNWLKFRNYNNNTGYSDNILGILPTNITIDVAQSGLPYEYNYTGKFNISQTVDLNKTIINNYISTCTPDSYGNCNILVQNSGISVDPSVIFILMFLLYLVMR